MKFRGLLFGYRHSALGLIIFASGFGMLLCTSLEAMGVGFHYRNMTAVLLMALSGEFVRRASSNAARLSA